jgi:hypothetical protein
MTTRCISVGAAAVAAAELVELVYQVLVVLARYRSTMGRRDNYNYN